MVLSAGPRAASGIPDDSVSTAKIVDNAVTYAKLQATGNGKVLLGRLASGGGAVAEQAMADNVVSILQSADYAAIKTLLQLTIGTNVQAWSAKLDTLAALASITNLSQLAGLSLIADRLPYANGTNTLSLATFTALARSLIAGAATTDMRTTLELDLFDLPIAIDNPTARTFTIQRKFSRGFTLGSITAGVDQGSCTIAVRKSGTAVTGLSAVSVTSTYGDTSASGGNVFATTDYLDVVVSGLSGSPNELIIVPHCTRGS